MKFKIVYTTTKNEEEAKKIALVLIKERLAACVNFFPINSIYRWQQKIEKAEETALIIKTKEDLVDQIIKRIKELHSYQLPCILCLDIEKGSPEFLGWIEKETK